MGVLPADQAWNVKDKSFPTQLHQNFNTLSIVLSQKESGIYSVLQTETGIIQYPEQNGGTAVKRKSFHIAALENGPSTQTYPHGLKFAKIFHYWGIANDTTAGIALTLPFMSTVAGDAIEVWIDTTNIYIRIGKNRSSYEADVYIEFLLK